MHQAQCWVLQIQKRQKSCSQTYSLARATDYTNHRNTWWGTGVRIARGRGRELWEHEGPDFIRSPKRLPCQSDLELWPQGRGGGGHLNATRMVRRLELSLVPFTALWTLSFNFLPKLQTFLCLCMCVGSCANCEQQVNTHWSMRTPLLFCPLLPAFHQGLGVAECSCTTDTAEVEEWKSGSDSMAWLKRLPIGEYKSLSDSFYFLNSFFLTFSFSKHIVEELTIPSLIVSQDWAQKISLAPLGIITKVVVTYF